MNSRTWDFLRGHHQWITLFISGSLFISSLLIYTAEQTYGPEESLDKQEMQQKVEKAIDLDIDDVEILRVTKENELEEDEIEDEIIEGTEKVEKSVDNTRVAAMGGDRIVTKDGVSFGYTKVLEDAELTAYSAGAEHTGKNPGDKWYGITYTGTQVQEGRTIAVDPKVIPLGWWVYIEGYGFRRAEDTGSAVKNNRIDIYFDNNDFVRAFGLKRGVKVWVIGPNDPRQ